MAREIRNVRETRKDDDAIWLFAHVNGSMFEGKSVGD